jgi:hypothetical protein
MELKHEVWIDPEGLTTFLLSGPEGDVARKLLEPGSRIIKYIYAGSHFDAMTQYYNFMEWGEYTTIYDEDKLPYHQ